MTSKTRKTIIVIGIVVLVAAIIFYLVLRPTRAEYTDAQLTGPDPVIAEADEETFPSIALAEPAGWAADATPTAAAGLSVARFAEGLDHPRSVFTLPNGDVLVAETRGPASADGGGITDWIMGLFMDRVGAGGVSADRITLLRDSDGDGQADQRSVLLDGLHSPFGMALRNGRLIVANTDALLSFPFEVGQGRITAEPEKLMDLPGGGNHWVRNVLYDAEGDRLFITVGSASNVAENGMAEETGRAAIHEYDFATRSHRLFAVGLRNPNGLAIQPSSGELWTTVNERDMIGPDVPPDYLTNVPVGAQYGWPWVYWKTYVDERVEEPMPNFLTEYTRRPEYALGTHAAPLGLVFADGNGLGGAYDRGAFVARHGSWNRVPKSGYDVVFVPFDARGNPEGETPLPVLTGFLTEDGEDAHGRPTWLAWDNAGGLLVSDDTAGIIWRVTGARSPASARAGSEPTR
ncbi:sorbosone dehydrogenase family protein [Croceicoccus sp. YJ47]|uniref:PQQ-dependent sugar dehydrogenase n=1 Tax=Croceicoccus sp. YJ47 TaxID=2798724 RepID=UPI001924E16B|nr:sorbosone dehydrogenase family protein [Croceicoccus sp. YJ47]QQN75431.1 sorbosone dehydrogenase family protein [Croceicoccus sp. YJ47]